MQTALYIKAQPSEGQTPSQIIAYDAFLQPSVVEHVEDFTHELAQFNREAKFAVELNTVYMRRSPSHFLLQLETTKQGGSDDIVPVTCYGSYDRRAVESGSLAQQVVAALNDFNSESELQLPLGSEVEIKRAFEQMIWPWSSLIKKNILITLLMLIVILLVSIVVGIVLLA